MIKGMSLLESSNYYFLWRDTDVQIAKLGSQVPSTSRYAQIV